jgi:hypothetical protein
MSYYQSLLPYQYNGKDKAALEIKKLDDQISHLTAFQDLLPELLDVNTAPVWALGIIARRVGLYLNQEIEGLDLEQYRFLIKATILKNRSQGIISSLNGAIGLQEVLSNLFNMDVMVIDNHDMTLTLAFETQPDEAMLDLAEKHDLMPTPPAVRYRGKIPACNAIEYAFDGSVLMFDGGQYAFDGQGVAQENRFLIISEINNISNMTISDGNQLAFDGIDIMFDGSEVATLAQQTCYI